MILSPGSGDTMMNVRCVLRKFKAVCDLIFYCWRGARPHTKTLVIYSLALASQMRRLPFFTDWITVYCLFPDHFWCDQECWCCEYEILPHTHTPQLHTLFSSPNPKLLFCILLNLFSKWHRNSFFCKTKRDIWLCDVFFCHVERNRVGRTLRSLGQVVIW